MQNRDEDTEDKATLVFVYNADSGLFNTVTDIAHKIFSPSTYSCQLCSLTHGYFSEREEWRGFIESLGQPCEFLHRDELGDVGISDGVMFPAVFLKTGRQLRVCLDATALKQCESLDELKQLIKTHCLVSG